MAVVSNVNRKASGKALIQQVATLKTIAGLAVQTHRAYESPGRGSKGLKQQDVVAAAGAGVHQPTVSYLENGKSIPGDPALKSILAAAGFNMSANWGGSALLSILQAIRDNQANLAKLANERSA